MEIAVQQLGKRYNYEWIFKGFDHTFSQGGSYAITGPNGSGKSTLLQILAGMIPETEGRHHYRQGQKVIEPDQYYQYISYASPYLELFEELTLSEQLRFHFRLKQPVQGLEIPQVAEQLYLEDALDKEIRHFSSGMKQRLKLGLALFTDAAITFLDEPTTNMDLRGREWYLEQVTRWQKSRILLVASNNPEEYNFCNEQIYIPDYK